MKTEKNFIGETYTKGNKTYTIVGEKRGDKSLEGDYWDIHEVSTYEPTWDNYHMGYITLEMLDGEVEPIVESGWLFPKRTFNWEDLF